MNRNEGERLTRLIDIILLLSQEPRRHNRAALAARYGVSERQITKDLQLLRDQLYLRVERDPQGKGYYLASVPRLPALQLDLTQALSLLLAAEAGHFLPGVSVQELQAALARLRAVLPEQLQEFLSMIAQTRRPSRIDAQRQKWLRQIVEAMTLYHTIAIHYRVASRGGELVERRLDPYGVLPFGRSWYVIGWCHLRRSLRTFKVDRIERLYDTRTPFRIRPEFSLQGFLATSWGIFEGQKAAAEEIELEFSQLAAPWITEEDWHPTQEVEQLPDGRIRFRVRIPVTPDFVRWVLTFGVEVTVLRPESLQEQVLAQARGILAKYGAREPGQVEAAEAIP